MVTYGKKKRSILPSFSSLRDFPESAGAGTAKLENWKSKMRASKTFISWPSPVDKRGQYQSRDDSIEEMASMLLDDTTMDQLNADTKPGRRLSQAAAAEIFSASGRMGSRDGKILPQLPKFVLNGDNVWVKQTAPSVITARDINQITDSDHDDHWSITSNLDDSVRKGPALAPSIPRKSSRRRSGGAKTKCLTSESSGVAVPADISRETSRSRISPPQEIEVPIQKSFTGAIDINNKVQAMLAATKTLKGNHHAVSHGPHAPPKKRRLADSKVLRKVKTAINDRLQGRGTKARGPVQDARLLAKTALESHAFQEEISASAMTLTTMEIRMNEGDNFKNPKIFTLTGHGNVRRKPLIDDGKSLRSRKSVDDPFSERSRAIRLPHLLTSYETQLRDDMSIDRSRENSLDLPQLKTAESPTDFRRSSGMADFDAILSSSPVAQSTPRIRLEPSFGNSDGKCLKDPTSDFQPAFDFDGDYVSDMELDSALSCKILSSSATATPVGKVSPNMRYSPSPADYNSSEKIKKHPSPSKAELETLEDALRTISGVSIGAGGRPTLCTLAPKDANTRYQDLKRRNQVSKGFLRVKHADLEDSISNITGHNNPRSSIVSLKSSEASDPQHPFRAITKHRFSGHGDLICNNSMLDIDELQWDDAAYIIGRRTAL